MKKILKIVGLVVLTLVIILALAIAFVPIDGYTILERIQERRQMVRELSNPLSPNYTAKSYRFESDWTVVSESASSLVDIKLNGSDQPIKVTPPASFILTWTLDENLLKEGFKCSVYGKDETGAFAERYISGPGEWKITGASFTRDREPEEGNSYTIDCSKGTEYNPKTRNYPNLVREMDSVDVWFTEETGQ